MRQKRTVEYRMQGAFVFVLLGLFAMMSVLLVLYGTQMYRAVIHRSEEGNAARILTSYVRSMVRAEDAADSVAVESYGSVTAVALHEQIGGEPYVTWIYVHDGMLCEQFTKEERGFRPEAGTKLIEAAAMTASLEAGRLHIILDRGSGELCEITEAIRSA